MNIEILGPRAVGKTTIGEAISKDLGISYISLGRLARREIEGQTDLGLQMQFYIREGLPYPEGLLVPLITTQLDNANESGGFVLDGYPRRRSEAEELVSILKNLNAKIDFIFKIEAPLDELIKRSRNRVVCKGCDALGIRSEKSTTCPHCNTAWTTRNDDTYEDLEKAYKLYESEKGGIVGVLGAISVYEALTFDGTLTSSFVISGLIHKINELQIA